MSTEHSKTNFIFIVGLPRTGSKLVENVLRNSPGVQCRISPETWFFGDLFRPGIRSQMRRIGDMQDDRNVSKLVEYMYSGKSRRTYWKLLHQSYFDVSRTEMINKILATDRSDRAIYVAIMAAYSASEPRWAGAAHRIMGDKTPGHLYFVPTLLEWFPAAKIVHTFRDPRAIAASELKRLVIENEKGLLPAIKYHVRTVVVVTYVSLTWLRSVRLHQKYSRKYHHNYYLCKYEDLVMSPNTSVDNLCEFVGLKAEKSMLRPTKFGSSFAENKGEVGFEKTAVYRWRFHLKKWVRLWLTLVTRRYLKKFGYAP